MIDDGLDGVYHLICQCTDKVDKLQNSIWWNLCAVRIFSAIKSGINILFIILLSQYPSWHNDVDLLCSTIDKQTVYWLLFVKDKL